MPFHLLAQRPDVVAARDGVVNPELMAWHNSGEVLLMIILGGLGHLRGAVIGAVAFTLLKEVLGTHALVGPLASPAVWSGLGVRAVLALLLRQVRVRFAHALMLSAAVDF